MSDMTGDPTWDGGWEDGDERGDTLERWMLTAPNFDEEGKAPYGGSNHHDIKDLTSRRDDD